MIRACAIFLAPISGTIAIIVARTRKNENGPENCFPARRLFVAVSKFTWGEVLH